MKGLDDVSVPTYMEMLEQFCENLDLEIHKERADSKNNYQLQILIKDKGKLLVGRGWVFENETNEDDSENFLAHSIILHFMLYGVIYEQEHKR